MPPLSPPTEPDGAAWEGRAARIAAALWAGYAIFVVISAAVGHSSQSVAHHYRRAAEAWLAGEPLYSGTEHGFLYMPLFAVLHVPFALLPFDVGAGAWRLLNVAVLAWGLVQLVRVLDPGRHARLFLVATACVLPLAYASARHGQSTVSVTGAMLAGAAAIARGRFGRAAFWAAVAVVAKPVGAVFLLLAGASHRRLVLPLLAAVAALLLLPFLARSPGYVAQQYADCLRMLRLAGDPSEPLRYPDLVCALRSLGLPLTTAAAFGIRIAAAIGTLALYLWFKRRLSPPVAALALYTLAACYLVLFSPRTEHNGYSVIAPALGLFVGHAWLVLRRPWLALAHLLVAFAIGQDRDLLKPLTGENSNWAKPFLTLVFLVLVGAHLRYVARATTVRSA